MTCAHPPVSLQCVVQVFAFAASHAKRPGIEKRHIRALAQLWAGPVRGVTNMDKSGAGRVSQSTVALKCWGELRVVGYVREERREVRPKRLGLGFPFFAGHAGAQIFIDPGNQAAAQGNAEMFMRQGGVLLFGQYASVNLENRRRRIIQQRLYRLVDQAELIQQLALSDRVMEDTKNMQAKTKKGTTTRSTSETLSFPFNGEVWFDEISNYSVDVAKGCQSGKGKTL